MRQSDFHHILQAHYPRVSYSAILLFRCLPRSCCPCIMFSGIGRKRRACLPSETMSSYVHMPYPCSIHTVMAENTCISVHIFHVRIGQRRQQTAVITDLHQIQPIRREKAAAKRNLPFCGSFTFFSLCRKFSIT